jgi:dolichyl-phosphate beta-glucosyltransferase
MPAPKSLGLSVVLPVYNEALVLERTFGELVPFLAALAAEGVVADGFEVICVDDGSRDASAEILARHAAADPRVRVLRLPENRGKGAAVRAGVLAAEGRLVAFMDADLSTPLAELRGFLGALESGYDVAIGNRRAPGSSIERHQPWLRETLGKAFTVLTRALLAPGVHDFTCGFKAFRAEAARSIFERSTLDGWAFDAELVVIAQALRLRLVQLPIAWRHEDDTKVRLGAAVLGSLRELAVIWVRRMRGGYR